MDLDPQLLAIANEAIAARQPGARQLSFPGWELPLRAMPADVARSAVFTARPDRDLGLTITKQIIPCENAVIEYSGPLLNQSNADVWQTLVFICRVKGRSSIETRGSTLIRMMREGTASAGKRVQTADRENLRKKIDALSKGQVSVLYNTGATAGTHLLSYHRSEDDRYLVEIPSETLKLFWSDLVLINYAVRVLINGQLAKWLHTYFAASLDPVLVEKIRNLANCQTKDDSRFRQLVREALIELIRVKALTNADIKNGQVLVSMDPTGVLPKPKRLKP